MLKRGTSSSLPRSRASRRLPQPCLAEAPTGRRRNSRPTTPPSSCSSPTRPTRSSRTQRSPSSTTRREPSVKRCPAADGSATFPALSLTGSYSVSVSKEGFGDEERNGHHSALRRNGDAEGQAAGRGREGGGRRLRHTEGVRADPQIGRRLDSRDRRDADPRPQGDDAAAAQFGLPAGEGHRRPLRQPDLLHHRRRLAPHDHVHARRREQRRSWGRQTMIATVPLGAVQEITVLSNAFSSEFGWTAGPALNIVTKSGTNELHGEGAVPGPAGRLAGEDVLDQGLLPAVGLDLRHAEHARRDQPGGHPDELDQFSGSIGGPLVKDRTFSSPRPTTRGRIGRRSSRRALPAFVLPADGSLGTRATTGRRWSTAGSITS